MDLLVSPATDVDADEVAALAARTFPLACPPDLEAEVVRAFIDEHLTPQAFREHLATPDHHVLCARTATGELVGYALLIAGTDMDPACADQISHRPTMGVSKIYVDPEHHGGGVSATLLAAVEGLATSRGARSVWLATNVANARARRFYAKHGFTERGNRTFVVGGVPNTDVVYEKAL